MYPRTGSASFTCQISCATDALWLREDVPYHEATRLLAQHVHGCARLSRSVRYLLHSKGRSQPSEGANPLQRRPPALFQRIHLDHLKINVKGATHSYIHALVMIDAMSLCCEIIPVRSTSAAETCRVLLREWIVRYDVFSEILTDRHRAFTGKLTQLLLE